LIHGNRHEYLPGEFELSCSILLDLGGRCAVSIDKIAAKLSGDKPKIQIVEGFAQTVDAADLMIWCCWVEPMQNPTNNRLIIN
jgi:hypothetical protein